jgi:hemerythrin
MELILWRDSFNTGFERVDTQHKYMVELINKLFSSLNAPNKEAYIKTIFLELYGYTVNHFSMEENVMMQNNYADYHAHKKEHVEFIKTVDEFKSHYLSGDKKVNVQLLNYLKDWLIKHILGTDKKTFSTIDNLV